MYVYAHEIHALFRCSSSTVHLGLLTELKTFLSAAV